MTVWTGKKYQIDFVTEYVIEALTLLGLLGGSKPKKYSLPSNGSLKVFTLSPAPLSDDYFLLYWQGVLMQSPGDYTLSPDFQTLTTDFTAGAGELLAVY